jgi:murein DD-endopeptidase MepM/ murein hydrolase activator NlpD
MISDVSKAVQITLPDGEKADPKTVAAKVQGMFMELMIKTMEESVGAEDGLFGSSSSAEIYRGMLREQYAKAMSDQLRSPFEQQLEKKMNDSLPDADKTGTPKENENPKETGRIRPLRESSMLDMPVPGRITSPVGWRRDPIDGGMKFHKGTDIAAAYGSEVKAVAGGVVLESGTKGGYGNAVVIQADDGRKMLYGHNAANLVQAGDRVQRGEAIAHVGSTGHSTGPHVHFEVMETQGSSDKNSGKGIHQPTKDGPGALNE